MKIRILAVFLLAVFLVPSKSPASDYFKDVPKEKKLLYLNAGMSSLIIAWGFIFWDYGETEPHSSSENWFDEDSPNGGSDKLGHFYTSYVFTHAFSKLYTTWGYDRDRATRLGALSSFVIQGIMEVGDSYSRHGFAYDDLVMNALGSGIGYLTYRYPQISEKFDIRLQYFPSRKLFKEGSLDIFTDYYVMKYLVAAKLEGFEFIKNEYLKYLEFHLGYFTRGYGDDTGTYTSESRNMYVGIGLNLSRIFEKKSHHRLSKFFNYYQMPYTYVPLEYNLND